MIKQYKIYIAFLLALTFMLSVLPGCAEEGPDPASGTSENTAPSVQTTAPTPTSVPVYTPPIWENVYPGYFDLDSTLQPGDVYISSYLNRLFSLATDATQVYPICVREATGVSREDVYKNAILPLGIEEDYLENEVIFVTQEQLAAIDWPEEYGIFLYKGVGPNYNIDKHADIRAYLESCEDAKVPVQVILEFPVVLPQEDLEYELSRIAQTYGVAVKATGENPYYGYAYASPQALLQLLEDQYVTRMVHQDSVFEMLGSDF